MSQSFAEITNKVRSANEIIEKVEAQMKNVDADKVKDLKKAVEAVKESFLPVRKLTIGVPGERGQAVVRESFTTANNFIQEARRYNNSRMGTPGETEKNAVRKAEQMIKLTEETTNEFFNTAWPKFKAAYDKADLSFFKDFE